MMAFAEHPYPIYPERGTTDGIRLVTDTSTTAGEYLHVRNLSSTDWYYEKPVYPLTKKKKSKKPTIAEGPVFDEPKSRPIQLSYSSPMYNNRMLFDKSGRLPKRIRKIKKQR